MNILSTLERYLFAFAAVWSLGASLYLFLTPVAIHEITAESTANGSQLAEETARQASWYEVQGAWGVAVLVIFAMLFTSAAVFAIRKQRIAQAATSVLAISITLLAGFSIGPLYLPAVFAVLAGWLVIGLIRIFRGGQETPG